MAVLADTNGEYLLATANIGEVGGANFSMCGWARITAAGVGNNNDQLFGASNNGNGRVCTITFNGSAVLGFANNGSATSFAQLPDIGRWFFTGFISGDAGGRVRAFWKYPNNGFNLIEHTNTTEGSVAFDRLGFFIGRSTDVTTTFQGSLAGMKVWNQAKLTLTEMDRESQQMAPFRLGGLYGYWPLRTVVDQVVDYSGRNHHMTATGTLASVDGPPIPEVLRPYRLREEPAAVGPTVAQMIAIFDQQLSGCLIGRVDA